MVRLVPDRHFDLRCSPEIARRLWPNLAGTNAGSVSMIRVIGRGNPPALVVHAGAYPPFAVALLAGAEGD